MDVLGTLDATLRTMEAERDWSGAVLVTRGGSTQYEGSWGLADRAAGLPITAATRFATASVTKMFTAVAVVDLVASGALAFERRVVDVLPPERRPSTLLPEVTVHHLLTHTSGIADYCEEEEDHPNHVADYGSLWEHRPCYGMQRPDDFLPLYGDLPPDRPPGGTCVYSNAGYVLLGALLEEVSGRPYTELVEDRVLSRAGMDRSGFFRSDEPRPDVATGYLPRASPDAPWRTNVFRVPVVGGADGGACCTTNDLDRFLRSYADGTLLGDLRDVVLHPHAAIGWMHHSGYGVFVHRDGHWFHEGGDPGVEAMIRRYPRDDLHVVVLANGEGLVDEVDELVVAAVRADLR